MSMPSIICHADYESKGEDQLEDEISDLQIDSGAGTCDCEDMPDTLGTRLKRLRKEKKITQTAMARELGISQHHISALENDTFKPGLDVLKKLAAFYDTTIDFLLFGISPENHLMKFVKNPETRWLFQIFLDASPALRERIEAMVRLLIPQE